MDLNPFWNIYYIVFLINISVKQVKYFYGESLKLKTATGNRCNIQHFFFFFLPEKVKKVDTGMTIY